MILWKYRREVRLPSRLAMSGFSACCAVPTLPDKPAPDVRRPSQIFKIDHPDFPERKIQHLPPPPECSHSPTQLFKNCMLQTINRATFEPDLE